jgi:hypothetical protein
MNLRNSLQCSRPSVAISVIVHTREEVAIA